MKTLTLWILILLSGIIAAYLGLIALLTIGVGFGHMNQQGFWVPILTGIVSFTLVYFLFQKVLKGFIRLIKMKEFPDI